LGDFHVKKIILPSGKAVEIVYFDALGGGDEAAATLAEGLRHEAPRAAAAQPLEICPCCDAELVYPVDWQEAGRTSWEVSLRCPNCEWTLTGTYGEETIQRFDETLDHGTEELVSDLRELTRANMEDDVERFVRAISAGFVLPEDF